MRITGKVKWFTLEKGYGFITHFDGSNFVDFYFHIKNVIGSELPKQGDTVDFEPGTSPKGKNAGSIRIIQRDQSRQPPRHEHITKDNNVPRQRDDRVECIHCKKLMVPRIKFERGEPSERLCPFCMGSQEQNKSCFIATAAFDDECHPTVDQLRAFRDNVLIKSSPGRTFVQNYYSYSPVAALWLERHPRLKVPARLLLSTIARVLRICIR